MKYLIGTNIKMYLTYKEALNWIREMDKVVPVTPLVDVALFPPFLCLIEGRNLIKSHSNISLGAQNMAWAERGALTGEISPIMLKELGIKYVELGHHERRLYFNETDEKVARKIRLALDNGLSPLVCVGEDAKFKDKGAADFVANQIDALVASLRLDDPAQLIIAYEPRWAIGVSQAASPKHAQKCCEVIRDRLIKHLGPNGE
ncbi:MAG: triose-phosphate isomerase, partial [Deltaproteobacteria bacterium]|nr:triose-phosphate isomerase [Deltaproteobacteria bacterium]